MADVRVQSRAEFMLDVIRDVRAGRAAPAAFQRPFVWTAADVEAMWTSILRGYPLGAFLLWKPKDARPHGRGMLGPIAFDAGDRADLILDGQNRLVTLAWSMTAPDVEVPDTAPGYDLFRSGRTLVADTATRTVRFADAADIVGTVMPIHHLFGSTSLFFRNAWRSDADDEPIGWLDDLGYRMREARVVRTTIENATPEEAKEAFLHIARAGVPMSDADFDAAVSWSGS